MTPDLLDLARAVVALPGWRWMPAGILLTTGARVECADDHGDGRWVLWLSNGDTLDNLGGQWQRSWHNEEREYVEITPTDAPLPDFTDAATGGCVLAMLGPCRVWIDSEGDAWMQEAGLDPEPFRTLAEACARVALARGRWA